MIKLKASKCTLLKNKKECIQFFNRVISATDGGVQKHYRVFRTKNSKFKNWQGCQFLIHDGIIKILIGF